MFDLTDITHVVKKTTKKATDLTMKPVQFVAAPLVDIHNKLKKSVFGPDLVFLTEIQEKEQYMIIMDAYSRHIETIKWELQKNKLPVRKRDAFIIALKLIWAAHETISQPQAKIEAMQNLLDELRTVCKEYIPTLLKEETFSWSKNTTINENEFKIIARAIAASKTFLQYCASEIEENSWQIACHWLPAYNPVQTAINKTQKELPELQKTYQESLFWLQSVIHDWYAVIHWLQQSAAHIRVYTNKEKSLFGPEKTKAKKLYENEWEKIKKIINHDFSIWKKNIEQAVQNTQKTQKILFAEIPWLDNVYKQRFNEYTKQLQAYEKQSATAKKQFASYSSSLTKWVELEQKKLKSSYAFMEKKLVTPFDQQELVAECIQEITKQHNVVHMHYHDSAHHFWQSSLMSEMPIILTGLALTQSKSYLMEKLTFVRQQLFHAKLMKRLRKWIIKEVQSYENIIDDHKIYAKETLTPVLDYLRDLTNTLQQYLTDLDWQNAQDNTWIEIIKWQIWDSITLDRLIALKRSWHNNRLWATIWMTHKKQLSDELNINQKELKIMQWMIKEIEKKHRINVTAFHEHKKTVQIIKTQEQKQRLDILKKQIANQEKTIHNIHEFILLVSTHIKELESLIKKYWSFTKNHESNGQNTKKRISELAKKLNKSDLKVIFDCTDTCSSALWV